MMGAVLQTVNVRLSPEQILYTLNHAADRRPPGPRRLSPAARGDQGPHRAGEDVSSFSPTAPIGRRPRSRRRRVRGAARVRRPPRTSSATSTRTRVPRPSTRRGRRACRRACTSATGSSCCTRWPGWPRSGSAAAGPALHRGDVYMPITPMFHVHAWGIPYIATIMGVKQVYPGPLCPGHAAPPDPDREGDLLPLRTDHPAHAPELPRQPGRRSQRLQDDHRRLGAVEGPGPGGARAGHRRLRRLRDVRDVPDPHHRSAHPRDARARCGRADGGPDQGRPTAFRWSTCASWTRRCATCRATARSAGEVVVRAPWLTQGYLGDRRSSETLWRGGYLHTNDIA